MQTVKILLDELEHSPHNVRKGNKSQGINELANNINEHGLINPLLVEEKDSKYFVVAGGRRLDALRTLAKNKSIKIDEPVPCTLLEHSANAESASLSENIMRAAMSPADECIAFSELINSGMAIVDIGRRFGCSETVVKKRLKLATLSPVILEALRNADIGLAEAQAYTLTEDHARQEDLYKTRPDANSSDIHSSLTEEKVSLDDRRVIFITREAYEAADGTITLDLFTEEDEENIYLEDVNLLNKMVEEKLTVMTEPVKAEGWSFVKTLWDRQKYYDQLHEYVIEEPVIVNMPDADNAQVQKLQNKLDKDNKEYNYLDDNWHNDMSAEEETRLTKQQDELERLINDREEEINTLKDKSKKYPKSIMDVGGAIISIKHDGTTEILRGLITKKDYKKFIIEQKNIASREDTTDHQSTSSKEDEENNTNPKLSAKLLENLTLHRSSAISAVITNNPITGTAALLYPLAMSTFYGATDHNRASCVVNVSMHDTYRGRIHAKGTYKGLDALTKKHDAWLKKTPDKIEDLWSWLTKQPSDTLMQLAAYFAARAMNDVSTGDRKSHAETLQTELRLDLTEWFTPTANNLFSLMTKPQLLTACTEMNVPAATLETYKKMKKDALATATENRSTELIAAGTPWLPHPLKQRTVKQTP